MRKMSFTLIALFAALFASQGIKAQNVLFEEKFDWGQGMFSNEAEEGAAPTSEVWQWMFMYKGVVGDATYKAEGPVVSRFVSPEFKLETNNVASFNSKAEMFADVNNDITFSVREVGGAWTDVQLPVADNTAASVLQEVKIPDAFNGKSVQIAFRYTAPNGTDCGKWIVSNLVVKSNAGGSEPVEKVDPAISFDVTEYNYKVGDAFLFPVLNNPNNVSVTYSSSNETVATIDVLGNVTVNAEGSTTIKAVSAETDKFLAGEASYVLTISKTGEGGGGQGGAVENIFEAAFENDACGFYVEGDNGVDNNIWQWRNIAQDMNADAYGKISGPLENYLVSPEMTLGTDNVVSFTSNASFFVNVDEDVALGIREVGGAWTDIKLPNVDNTGFNMSQEITVPAEFNGKKVQIGFKYTSVASSSSGMWYIDNVVVKGTKSGDAPAEKADPAISFNVGDVEAVLGQAFEAPVLNNPNNVEIVYSSYNPEVATVDPQTGAVTLVGEGFTTITATSVENDQFKSVFVNYVLTVKPASAASIIFEENFEISLGDFVVEGFNGQEGNPIWINTSGYAKADAYYKISEQSTNYLVSPAIKLDAVGNEVEFTYYFTNYDTDNEIKNQIGFCVRTVGGEWEEIELPTYAAGEVNCVMTVPGAYAGKEVQFGFRYTARSSMLASVWNVDNLIVRKGAAAPVEKKDPELSFAQDKYEFYFDHSSFDGVALNNPNNLEVVYSIENNDYSVADVEPSTGKVWIYNCGTVVITATSAETDEFKEGKASYTLIITEDVPTGIEGITADDLENGKVYDLQGRRVNKLGKGVFIVNGKKVVIK